MEITQASQKLTEEAQIPSYSGSVFVFIQYQTECFNQTSAWVFEIAIMFFTVHNVIFVVLIQLQCQWEV